MAEDEWDAGDFSDLEDRTVDLLDMMTERRGDTQRRSQTRAGPRLDVTSIRVINDALLIPNRSQETLDPFDATNLEKKINAATDELASSLHDSIVELDNTIFQDGIPLPIKGWCIAPIGACRARCNLTGTARFELNVARNAINESPNILTLWAQEVGAEIQRAVIDAVKRALREDGCDDVEDDLFTPLSEGSASNLFQYTSEVLRKSLLVESEPRAKRKRPI